MEINGVFVADWFFYSLVGISVFIVFVVVWWFYNARLKIGYKAVVIQNAVNDVAVLSTYGGTVLLSQGNYSISSPINMTSNCRIIGEGIDATKLFLASGSNCNIFQCLDTTRFFVVFEHFYANGNSAGNTAGNITSFGSYGGDILINDVFFENASQYLVASQSVWAYRISNSVFEYGGVAGLGFWTGSDVRIDNCKIIYNMRGLVGSFSYSSINNCFFYKNTLEAIKITGGTGLAITGNVFVASAYPDKFYHQINLVGEVLYSVISGNTFDGSVSGTTYSYYQIALDSGGGKTPDYACVVGNTFKSSASKPVFVHANVIGEKISANTGFVTENTIVSANTTASTVVVNHGLYAAATAVWVSFSDMAITGYTWTSTATQITVTVVGVLPASWTCYVKAEYVP